MTQLRLPPWPLIIVQVGWLWSAAGFVYFAFSWQSASHLLMMVLSVFLLIGIGLRWRAALWASTLAYALFLGADLGRLTNRGSLPALLAASLGIAVFLIVLHQLPTSLRWFNFQNHRRVRLRFWLFAAIACVLGEFAWVILLPREI